MPQNFLNCITTYCMRVKNLSNTQDIYQALIYSMDCAVELDALKLYLPADRKSMASLLQDYNI